MFDFIFRKYRTACLLCGVCYRLQHFMLLREDTALTYLADLNKPLLFIQKSLRLMEVWAVSGFRSAL
jgi:hypothetical protein